MCSLPEGIFLVPCRTLRPPLEAAGRRVAHDTFVVAGSTVFLNPAHLPTIPFPFFPSFPVMVLVKVVTARR